MAKFTDIEKIVINDDPESKSIDITFTLPDGTTETISQGYGLLYYLIRSVPLMVIKQ